VRARVVLLCVNADRAPEMLARFAPLCADAHVIGFFLWETDHPPESHRFGALAVDEIWTPSHFVADAYRQIAHAPVSMVGKGLRPPAPARWQRLSRRFRRDGAFTFLHVADFRSSIIRKNPLDAVRAFRAAFDAGNANVRLVMKLREIDRAHWSNFDGHWDETEALAAADPRIEFLIGDLSDDEYWALIGACDAMVSLHRGEGFCYPVADAMMLGRPVVVTDYSSTRDFCSEETAFLVEADVVPVPPAHMRCTTPVGQWGLPRLDSAVAAMRAVVARRTEAAARAAAGQARIASQYDFSTWRDDLLARLAPYLAGRGAVPGTLVLSSLAQAWSATPGHAD
jgi:glycosyltransferase involved in cell wall biosynthesis